MTRPGNSRSCQRRFRHGNGRISSLMPGSFLAGSCIVVVFASVLGTAAFFPPLLVADASMTTTKIARGIPPQMLMTDLDAIYNFEREEIGMTFHNRRIEESENDHSTDFDRTWQQSEMNIEECTVPAGKCEACSYSELRTEEACHETGKSQLFECILPGDSKSTGTEDEASVDSTFIRKSCKYTQFEEEMAMFRLQLICLAIGLLSVASVRKQKRMSVSMFDRRKQQGAASLRSNSNPGSLRRSGSRIGEDDEEIEFTPMTNQQRERVSLVERMEII